MLLLRLAKKQNNPKIISIRQKYPYIYIYIEREREREREREKERVKPTKKTQQKNLGHPLAKN
jgi:hypothetical protein